LPRFELFAEMRECRGWCGRDTTPLRNKGSGCGVGGQARALHQGARPKTCRAHAARHAERLSAHARSLFQSTDSRRGKTLALHLSRRARQEKWPRFAAGPSRGGSRRSSMPFRRTKHGNVPVPCPTFLSGRRDRWPPIPNCCTPGPRQAAGVSKNVHFPDRTVGRSAPRFYAGIERVIHWLTEELVALGHDATLYASGDLVTSAKRGPRVWRNRVWAKSTTNLVRSPTVQPPRSTMQGRLPVATGSCG
jgi:hypothetical protein